MPRHRSYAPLLAVLLRTLPALALTTQHDASRLRTDHEVRDDGSGLWVDAGAGSGERIGAGNPRARPRHLYGAEHRFGLGNFAAGGCVVVVEILHHTRPAAPPGAS